jgi:hypothetical protein
MIQEIDLKNLQNDDLMFHFVPEIGENTYNNVNKDVRAYVNHFLEKLCKDYNVEPKSIGLVGDIKTLSIIIGRLVQDYEMYKDLNEEFSSI